VAFTSRKVIYAGEDGIGIPVEEEVDGNLFGVGTEAQEPGSGTTAGDMFVVLDGSGYYRLDIWDGSAWKYTQGDPVNARGGGSIGDILYRGATKWVVLPAGTATFILQANGAAAPSWVAAPSGSGITEAQHEVLDTLVHEIAETNYLEVTRSSGQVTDVIVWETAAKLKKIRETNITYASGQVSVVVDKQYDSSGTIITGQTLTQTITRSSGQVASIASVET
jgi:hypothetical protein